ncbi:MAG: nickel pincer cofactor biosynthesis protein LarC [Clostridiales bacterium]|nr:nickel pincer cofactor biosynthesis protein LarC [Clostridiales bacterium]
MKTLYLDLGMGAAGDMLTAALLELLPEQDKFIERLNGIGIPGVRVEREPSVKCGITGTHIKVTVNGEEEGEHHHHHEDGHHHHHHHSSMADIERLVNSHLDLPANIKKDILSVYRLIAEAESRAHGVEVTDIHFHEVGTMDALADISAVCMLMNELSPDEIVASPVHVGCGQVQCAHGILPVPAPATAYILQGIPTYGGEIKGELCTPTGAALLRHFVSRFGEMPVIAVEKIGYGMGKKDFPAANCLRTMLGETQNTSHEIVELSFNVDDMTAEEIGFAMEMLFAAGANEVFTVPVGMKKNRPGTMICVLCEKNIRDEIVKTVFRHTSTLGIRENVMKRHVLERKIETLETEYGPVRRKISGIGDTGKSKLEYEDAARIAREKGISLREAVKLIEG